MSVVRRTSNAAVSQRPSSEPKPPSTQPKQVEYGINRPIDTLRDDFDQGRSNACGTTALAIALHRLGKDIARTKIDRSIRNFDLFTSMGGITSYARSQGFQAEQYNNGSFEQLQRDIGAGRQVIVLADVGSRDAQQFLTRGSDDDFQLHYMAVTDVGVDQNGQKYVTLWNWGNEETMPYEKFEQIWSNLEVKNQSTGWNRSYVLVDKATAPKLAPSNATESRATDKIANGVTEVANGAADIGRGGIGSGLERIVKGVGSTVSGAVGFVKGLFS